MRKLLRCGLGIIMVLFIMSTHCVYASGMSIPVYAYESAEFYENQYVYDDGEELKEETMEVLQNTLNEFWKQTDIRVIVVTLQDEEGKTGREITEKAMQKHGKEDVVVILFSLNRKIINCSYENVDIFPYIRNIMGISENEYNTFVENSVVGIIKKIAEAENKKFSTRLPEENTNILSLLGEESLVSMIKAMLAIGTVIIIALVVIILVIFLIILCIKNLIDSFSS